VVLIVRLAIIFEDDVILNPFVVRCDPDFPERERSSLPAIAGSDGWEVEGSGSLEP